MVIRKISVFVLVLAFHVLVLGVVYLSTREPSEDKPIEEAVVETQDDVPTVATENSGTPQPVANPVRTPARTQPVQLTSKVHIVAKGDFLGKIAAKYKVSSADIMALNKIDDPNKITLGQKIKIPAK